MSIIGRVTVSLKGRVLGPVLAAMAVVAGLVGPTAPVASAESCPQAELIFARGRLEAPGAGQIGNALVSAVRDKTGKNVRLYAVKYPADTQVDIGANDMSQRISYMTGTCPDTRLVLGGYSLGAAVTDVVVAVPIAAFGFKNPMPDGADGKDRRDHAVRQRQPVGRADRELHQPGAARQDHRAVPR